MTPSPSSVLFQSGGQLYALPADSVVETLRPLPLRPVAAAPDFVLGLATVRGASLPVVELTALLGGPSADCGRWLTLRVGSRRVVLAVERVLGLRRLDGAGLSAPPPLLGEAAASIVNALGTLDAELLLVLRAGQLVPPETWTAMEAQAAEGVG